MVRRVLEMVRLDPKRLDTPTKLRSQGKETNGGWSRQARQEIPEGEL